MLRVQCIFPESMERFHINQRPHILVIQCFDLLNLVGGTEAVKEMHKRKSCADCRQMRNGAEVHNLLSAGRSQHGKAGHTAAHNVGVITENGQCMGRQRSCRNMEHAREELACNLVHIRNHQQQALRRRISRSQSAGLQGAVNRTSGAAFRLHLDDIYRAAKQIFLSLCCPGVHMLRHRRGRGNWENAGNFSKSI
ncbi:hypothetical protein SDC9_94955 [bioreactor metagenome]|uniref:Uncharacterized protein n=1 Tax=bioreactor metagenome TaxID=1076179 RepID=A0A645A7G5_9ZZZZ